MFNKKTTEKEKINRREREERCVGWRLCPTKILRHSIFPVRYSSLCFSVNPLSRTKKGLFLLFFLKKSENNHQYLPCSIRCTE